jgi:photosystem II stability/assembly factor-like uncharacterized protein
MERLGRVLSSIMPFAIIGGLLYAGIFIKPKATGASVEPAVLQPRDAFYGIAAPDDKVIWAVGRDGKVVRSEDAGTRWASQQTPSRQSLQSLVAWDDRRAFAVGNQMTALRTEDGGKKWSPVAGLAQAGEAQKLIRARSGTGGKAWIVGEMGSILASADYGQTWARLGKQEDLAWNDIAAHGAWLTVVGEFGHIRLSEDGGMNWKEVANLVKSSLCAVRYRDERNGVAVGLEGVILATKDGGRTWSKVVSGTAEHLYDVAWTGERWVAVGDKGLILTAGEAADAWAVRSISERNYAWHTALVSRGDSLYVAGATLAMIDSKNKVQTFK